MTLSKPNTQRTAFLGDSITDGNSYCALVTQALCTAGVAIHPLNAGIGGDTASGMLGRLDRDVFAYHPTFVTISAGVNDTHLEVSLADYAATTTAIVDQLQARRIDVLLLTASILGAERAHHEAVLVQYNAHLRALATERGLPVADVYAAMNHARDQGLDLLEADGTHPNQLGHVYIARAVLDGLGYNELLVPDEAIPSPLPGIVSPWHLRAADSVQALTPPEAASLTVDASWTTIDLPQTEPASLWWLTAERNRGFAVDIELVAGAAELYFGIAELESNDDRDAYLNTGASLRAVWLNGAEVYRQTAHHGWHAGRDRIPVRLKAGANRLVIETGGQFFLSITDDNQW